MLAAEGVEEGELGLAFVGADEMRALKREHLGIDEADGRALVPARRTRAGAGRGCRARSATSSSARTVVGEAWRAPLVHGLLHLLGYDHGDEMEARERAHAVPA